MKTLSVVLATHNEAQNIERCLAAVQNLADEIVVVDGESQDATVEIAKKFKAQIISTTNKANFHINKQLAMDAATKDFVLQLDADEVVDKELYTFIEQLKTSGDHNGEVAWWLKRKNWFLGKFLTKGGQYPDPVVRLYKRGYAKLPQKDVHEQMVVSGKLDWAEGHLLHYSNPTFSEYLRKFNTYTSFKAQQLADRGVRISLKNTVTFLFLLPFATWFSLYIRHRGYVDGWSGFVFAAMSGFHHQVAYLKLWEMTKT